jgi:pimeloyl-ACP methyl ester carboxylesterase
VVHVAPGMRVESDDRPATSGRKVRAMDLRFDAGAGRSVGAADFGDPDGTAVLWCHGGPGSRLEARWLDHAAADAGLRIIGVDRPGYGLSDPRPGRSIKDAIDDLFLVADRLGIDRFATVGVSTGGAYALGAAALAPQRVLAVVACCSMTDMSWGPGRATMDHPHAHAVWDAPDRDAAITAAIEAHGEDGSKMLNGGMAPALAELDAQLFADPSWMKPAMQGFGQMFTFGLQGYADDRIADSPGWTSFDVTRITCPVSVLHGTADKLVAVIQAEHTTALVPGAELVLMNGHGHFSIEALVVPELSRLLG